MLVSVRQYCIGYSYDLKIVFCFCDAITYHVWTLPYKKSHHAPLSCTIPAYEINRNRNLLISRRRVNRTFIEITINDLRLFETRSKVH